MGKTAITYRLAREDDFDAMTVFDGHAFGGLLTDEQKVAVKPTIDFDRFHLAHHDDELVGISGVYTREITVPGGAQLGAGGVTWVSVAPTHRRRGVLREFMNRMHDDIDERGEPLAMLTASEGGIYERFGYGVATQRRVFHIDRRRTQIKPEYRPQFGEVRLTDLNDLRVADMFDRYRRQRVGEISRPAEVTESFRVEDGPSSVVALHADGFATWKLKAEWHDGHPAYEAKLLDLAAITPEAHAALWHTVLSLDLVGPITGYGAVHVDDELPYLLTDPRALRTTDLNDMVWLHIRNVGAALAGRTYGSDDSVVVEVCMADEPDAPSERWKIDGSSAGAAAKRVRSRPDIVTDRASLGAMYLGGVRPSTLLRGRRLTARSDEALRRADHFFAADRIPYCSTGF